MAKNLSLNFLLGMRSEFAQIPTIPLGICSDSYHSARIHSECVGEGKLLFRASQENLQIECEQAAAQRALYKHECAAREARHRQELEEARRGSSSDFGKGKQCRH